jgi:hypothetical protein
MQADQSEVSRSTPDYRVYIPDSETAEDSSNQHFLVEQTPAGTLIAIWTQATGEAEPNQHVVSSRSTDGGEHWSSPTVVDGPSENDVDGEGLASWGFPIIAPSVLADDSHRIYCFYNKNIGINDARDDKTGVLRGRYSDDDGRTWSDEHVEYAIKDAAISHPDSSVPQNWIVYQSPTVTNDGAVLAGFTHWASDEVDDAIIFDRQSEVRFLRFENILREDDPHALRVTTWPDDDHGLQVPNPNRPGISVAQEPSVRRLPDGRFICVMRTLQGCVYFALSADNGRTWDTPRPLHYDADSPGVIENPIAPCPLYRFEEDRYLLVFFNNDGTGHGADGPMHIRVNRTPVWFSVGEMTGDRRHPLEFTPPRVLADNDRVPLGPNKRTEIGSYPSFVETDTERVFWYPDRKHFLLGKEISNKLDTANQADMPPE